MLRSGLLAEAGAGRGCLSLKERPSEAITTQHTSHVNTDNYYTVSMLRIIASWSTDWDSADTAARTDCRHVHHCSALQTADPHLLHNFLQMITLQFPHADPGEAGRGHGWLVTDIMPSSDQRPATSWPMELGADQPQPLPALYQWSAPRRLCTQYLLETA